MVLCSGYFDTPETHLSLRLNRCDIRNSIHLHGCLASRTLVGHASTCHRRTDRRRIYPFDCLCLPAWICTTSRNTTNALRPSSELKMKARYFPLGSGYEKHLRFILLQGTFRYLYMQIRLFWWRLLGPCGRGEHTIHASRQSKIETFRVDMSNEYCRFRHDHEPILRFAARGRGFSSKDKVSGELAKEELPDQRSRSVPHLERQVRGQHG